MPSATIAHSILAIMDGLQLQWLASESSLDAGDFEPQVEQIKLT